MHRAVQVLGLCGFLRVALLRPAVLAHELLDVRRGAVARDAHEHGLVRASRHARHRAHLRIRELPAREARADLGQMLERAGDADFLARGDHPDAALPIEPVRRARQQVPGVGLVAVELGDEREEPAGRGVQVAPELGNLTFEAVEGFVGRAGERRGRRGRMCGLGVHSTNLTIAGHTYSTLTD